MASKVVELDMVLTIMGETEQKKWWTHLAKVDRDFKISLPLQALKFGLCLLIEFPDRGQHPGCFGNPQHG